MAAYRRLQIALKCGAAHAVNYQICVPPQRRRFRCDYQHAVSVPRAPGLA